MSFSRRMDDDIPTTLHNFTFPSSAPNPTSISPPRAALPTLSVAHNEPMDEDTELTIQPALFFQPPSPALSSPASFETADSSSPPANAPSFLPPPPPSGLAARRASKNKKMLSLVVPSSATSPALASPSSPGLMPGGSSSSETRSLPPSPVSLVTYIGVEGSEVQDRLIGRLMLKQQADEMREALKGGRGMKRRTSIPRLGLSGQSNRPAALNLGTTNGGSAVQLIRRDAVEQSGLGGAAKGKDAEEEFPYALGPREILPGIWLGSEQNARDPKVLRDWGITHVLNVAKEVECPWVGEEVEEDSEESLNSAGDAEASTSSLPASSSLPQAKHRRTKTQGGASLLPPVTTRPVFVRPTVSTPNLLSAFQAQAAIPSTVVVPSPVLEDEDLESMSMTKSFSAESTSHPSPRARRPPPIDTSMATSSSPLGRSSSTSIHFPANRKSGRPATDYLWLKWGHDEADLVEASKFQRAFEFLDEARKRDGKALVHCQCGVSRSATVVIAYCMREAARALDEGRDVPELKDVTGMHDAYSFVKEKSEWVGPNLCLVFQLVAFERTLRGGPMDLDEDEEPPFPRSPHTPLTSEGSSDAQLSTPELMNGPPSSSYATSPTYGSATRSRTILVQDGDNDDELLSPMAEALDISAHNDAASPKDSNVTSPGVFILPIPQRRRPLPNLSPLPLNVTAPPPTPFQELASPAPDRLNGLTNGTRFAFPSAPRATLLTSTPTASAFSLSEAPSAAQLSLARGMGGLPKIPQSPVDDQRPRLFGTQTPTQRRASHRRVFSWNASEPPAL